MFKTVKFFTGLALSIISITPQRIKVDKMKKANDPDAVRFSIDFIRKWGLKRLKRSGIELGSYPANHP